MSPRLIRTREELEAVVADGQGYLYNDFLGRDPKMCPIHSVGCAWVRRMLAVRPGPLSVKKVWSSDLQELVDWVEQSGKVYGFCGSEPHLASGRSMAQRSGPANPVALPRPVSRTSRTTDDPDDTPQDSFHGVRAASSLGTAEFWSEHRLQFDSKPLTRAMKGALASIVEPLEPASGELLSAIYTSSVQDAVDAENVLFYNVGVGAFARAARHGLRLVRRFEVCSACDVVPLARHHHRYELLEPSRATPGIRRDRELAAWRKVSTPALHEFQKPADVWLAMRRSGFTGDERTNAPYFGLDIEVSVGAGGSRNPVAFVKPLIDGVVSAFHTHDGSQLEEILLRLSSALGIEQDEARALLMNGTPAPLEPRRLLWPRADGLQWNPGDDRCVWAQITVAPSPDGGWSHSGRLFEVSFET